MGPRPVVISDTKHTVYLLIIYNISKDFLKTLDSIDNPTVVMMKYSGIYLLLFFGMATGSIWEWLAPRSSEKSDKKIKGSMLKLFLRLFIGSIISFSFFIGSVMGIGAIGFTFSSAILAFHFGLVHSDPTDLVRSLQQKSA